MGAKLGLIFGAYLLGSLPLLYLLGRIRGFDLRQEDDMHLSLWHKVGRGIALIGISWDIIKGAIPVLIAKVLDFKLIIVGGAGLAAVIGEMWPIFLKFKGEKANSTGIGMVMALLFSSGGLAFLAFVIGVIPILIAVIIRILPVMLDSRQPLNERLRFSSPPSRSMPLGLGLGFALFPIGCWAMGLGWEIAFTCLILFILIMVKRLTAGLKEDLKGATNKKSILINRLIYDRSYR